jgi:hypothetical protein
MSTSRKLAQLKVVSLIVYGCFLIALSLLKTNEVLLPVIYQIEAMLGGDKLMHLILSSLLCVIALWALVPNLTESSGLNIGRWLFWCLWVCVLLILGLLLDEFHQAFVSSRRFELLDFAYGVGGIGIGFVVFIIINSPKLTRKY